MGYPGKRPPATLSPQVVATEDSVAAATLNAATQLDAESPLTQLQALMEPRGIASQAATSSDAAMCGERLDVTIDVDAVVVGSGAGGGVAAGVLARAGLRVLVVEKGRFTPAKELADGEEESLAAGYERAGVLSTADTGMTVLAGSGLGGGTRVNWCASFRTPPHVRDEWAREHGVTDVASERYTHALDVICARLGVHDRACTHLDSQATMFRRGLSANGHHEATIPQNCATPDKCVQHCSLGCAGGGKQDTVRTFLADAVATGRAAILTTCRAERVVTCKDVAPLTAPPGPPHSGAARARRAAGVLVKIPTMQGSSLTAFVRSSTVVCAAGALHTPALLLRSALTGRGNVGRHLRLHPATIVHGFYDEPLPCGPSWNGPMFTAYSRQNALWEEPFKYGPLLAVSSLTPSCAAGLIPFSSGAQFQRDVLSLHQAVSVLMFTRDGGKGGSITLGRDGEPMIHYSANSQTQAAMTDAMCTLLSALRSSGATRIVTLHQRHTEFNGPPLTPTPDGEAPHPDPEFQDWLKHVRAAGAHPMQLQTGSAHQMGTARMGADPATSVVDPYGEMWDVAGVFVADASSFPTASGVNPMVTIEAMSYMTCNRLAEKLTGSKCSYSTKCESFEW